MIPSVLDHFFQSRHSLSDPVPVSLKELTQFLCTAPVPGEGSMLKFRPDCEDDCEDILIYCSANVHIILAVIL